MANELQIAYPTGNVLYAVIRNAAGQVWDTVAGAFEAYDAASWAAYDVALTEQGASGYYVGDFPSAITAAGTYNVDVRRRAGASPAVGDATVGLAEIVWDGSAEVEEDPAGYGAIYDWVRDALRKSEADLPDTDPSMVRATGSIVPLLIQRYPCIGDYDDLTGSDLTAFDEAAGLLVAARMRPTLLAGENEGRGMLTQLREGDEERRWSAGVKGADGSKTLEQEWIDQAQAALNRISCIREAAITAAASFSLFGLAGRSRARQAATGSARKSLAEMVYDAGMGGSPPSWSE